MASDKRRSKKLPAWVIALIVVACVSLALGVVIFTRMIIRSRRVAVASEAEAVETQLSQTVRPVPSVAAETIEVADYSPMHSEETIQKHLGEKVEPTEFYHPLPILRRYQLFGRGAARHSVTKPKKFGVAVPRSSLQLKY